MINLLRNLTLGLLAIAFVAVGITHFTNPDFFVAIVPPYLPAPLALVISRVNQSNRVKEQVALDRAVSRSQPFDSQGGVESTARKSGPSISQGLLSTVQQQG